MPATTTATRPTRRFGVDAGHDHYKWWALSCTSVGMLLATINSGTLIIALPDLERSLHTSLLTLVWVILVYMIASTVLVLSAGRLSDQFGRKNAYIGGFIVFAAASLGAGFSTGGTELIVWRILQGIGGAFLFANAAAIVTDAFPREQLGVAMGTNTMVAAVGLVIGPVLGGALVDISWHWVFWFNVPFALLGSLWAFSILREITGRGEDTTFDWARHAHVPDRPHRPRARHLQGRHRGLARARRVRRPDRSRRLPAAVRRDRAPPPVADARSHDLQQPPVQSRPRLPRFLNGLARFALMFLFVFYFQGVQGDTPILAGLKLAPLALGMLVASPLAGIYADRNGSRALASIGMLVTAIGLALMTTLQQGHQLLVARRCSCSSSGVGSGMFNSPNTAAMMGVVAPHRRGIASGARVLVQNTGAVLSIAFVMAVVTNGHPKDGPVQHLLRPGYAHQLELSWIRS